MHPGRLYYTSAKVSGKRNSDYGPSPRSEKRRDPIMGFCFVISMSFSVIFVVMVILVMAPASARQITLRR